MKGRRHYVVGNLMKWKRKKKLESICLRTSVKELKFEFCVSFAGWRLKKIYLYKKSNKRNSALVCSTFAVDSATSMATVQVILFNVIAVTG